MKLRSTLLFCLTALAGFLIFHFSGNISVSNETVISSESSQAANVSGSAIGAEAIAHQSTELQEPLASSSISTQTLPPNGGGTNEPLALANPSIEEWLAEGTELVEYDVESSQAKQVRVRVVELDFKYPFIRVEETTTAGIAVGASEPSREVNVMVADHLLVSLASGVGSDQFSETISKEGFTVREVIAENSLLVAFELSEGRDDLRYAQERLSDFQGMIEVVEPDYIVHAHAQPADSSLIESGKLWGLHNIGRGASQVGADIDALRGWNIRSRAPNTIVAVIDTGLRLTHEKLKPNLWRNSGEILDGIDNDNNGFVDDIHGYDFRDRDGDPSDLNGHGTHVAGIIGADDAANGGLVGVAWDVQLMALRFLDTNGFGTTSDAIKCIDYARNNGARVLNNSWGGAGYSRALKAAIERSDNSGCIFVASAGNSNRDIDVRPHYPAAYNTPNIVSVAATNSLDDPTFFTCRGKRKVDIAAPGQNILSAGHYSDTARRSLSGTSMAAPFVTGILALLDAEFPSSSNSALLNRLYSSADPLGANYAHFWLTGGRANLFQALQTTSGRPSNDNRVNAYHSEGYTWAAWEVDTADASFEAEQFYIPAPDGTGDLWFEFTAKSNQPLGVSTLESEAAIRTHILDAKTKALLMTFEGAGSRSIPAAAGDTFLIAVETIGTSGGLLSLDIRQRPDNDERVDAYTQEGLFWETQGENGGATLSLGEKGKWGFAKVDRSVWWKWQAPRTGRFTLSTHGSDFDTVLAVYRDEDEFFLSDDSTHLVFAIDRSAFTASAYRTSAVYDANGNGSANEVIDQQIAAVIQAIRLLRSQSLYFDEYEQSFQIAILLFDETAEFLDLDPDTPELDLWAYVSDFRYENAIEDVYTALRSITPSEVETVDYNSAFIGAQSLLDSVATTNPRLVVMTPGQNVADLDYQVSIDSFRQNNAEFAVMAPSVVSDIEALQVLDGDVLEYSNYREVADLMRSMIAVSDDASWYGLWSRVTFKATEGETYYFGLAGYQGEYGKIELQGRDPDFPFISKFPSEVTVDLGERASYVVEASGQEPLLYQWYKDGVAIAGAHGSSYSIWSAEIGDVGKYHVTVSNMHGETSSDPVNLQTNEIAPRFTFNPQSAGFIEQEGLRLLAAAIGTQPITYQWYHNQQALEGQTDAILNIPVATADNAGDYHVVASNSIGSTRSANAIATAISGEFEEWKLREGNPGQEHLNGIAYGDQTFVTVGDSGRLMLSDDATHWQRLSIGTSADLKGVAYGDGVFVAAGMAGAVYLAESPAHWELINLSVSADWRNVEYVDGVFWLTGNAGALARSLNGRDWELVPTDSTSNLIGLTWGHDGFLVISDTAQYLISDDGTNWTEHTALNGSTSYYDSRVDIVLKDVTYFDGKYYIGNNDDIRAFNTTEISPLFIGHSTKPSFFANANKKSRLLGFGGSSSYVSTALYGTGGRSESGRFSITGGTPRPVSATYGFGFYVTVGLDGLILRSRDGINWESGWSITEHRLHDLAYAKGRYIATNRHGAIFTSPDGLWWETVREKYWSGTASNSEQTFIVEHGNYIYVLSPRGDHGRSQDGILWEWFNGDRNITSVVSHGSKLLYTTSTNLYESIDVHGAGGAVFESSLTSPTLTYGNGIFLLRANGVTRYSTDGVAWSDVELTGDSPNGMLVAKGGIFLSQNMRWSDDGLDWKTAGVLTRIPAQNGEISYKVADGFVNQWANSGVGYSDWPKVPDDTTFGYDLNDQLSFEIPEPGNLSDEMHGMYSSLYIRYYLGSFYPEDYLSLELRTRYNDGFLVYMGNQVVAGSKAADSSEWDSLAIGNQSLSETETLAVFDLTSGIEKFPDYGSKMIAFQVLNGAINDGLFLFDFDLYGIQRLDLDNVFAAGEYFFGVDTDGHLFVSEDARDWVRFTPETGVLNKVIASPSGYTAVSDYGSVYQTRDQAQLGAKVYLRRPAESFIVTVGEVVPLEVDVYAVDSEIMDVTFYANNTVIASLSEAPYIAEWKPDAFGNFDLYAVATGSNGLQSISDRVNIQVTALEPWQLSSGNGEPLNLNAMEWIGGRWLAPADSGKLYNSSDGIAWDFQKLSTEEDLLSVAEAPDGTLVVGGADGRIFVSYDDGRNWLEEAQFLGYPLKTVAYAFDRFYFAAYGKIFASSSDFQDWSIVVEQAGGSIPVGMEYGDGRLMLAWGSVIYETTDGVVWTEYTGASALDVGSYQDLDFYDGAFYLCYRFEVLNHPILEPYTINTEGSAIARLDANSASIVYSSVYGETLNTESGVKQVRPSEKLHFTEDGRGLFLGADSALYDPDADTWTSAETSTLNGTFGFGALNAPASYLTNQGHEFWIIYGQRSNRNDPVVPAAGRPLRSANGLVWFESAGGLKQKWGGVSIANDLYFSFGNGGSLMHSPDAENWTLAPVGTAKRLRAIEYGGGVYVAVGHGGLVASSSDLETWHIHDLGTKNDLHSIRYANGQFIAAGFNAVYRSMDGVTWADVAPIHEGFGYGYQITSVRYVNGHWALVGSVNYVIFAGQISEYSPLGFVSNDQGDNWSEMSLPYETSTFGRLYDLIYHNDQYLLIGSGWGEAAWTSPNLVDWTVLDETVGRFSRQVTQANGMVYLRESSSLFSSNDLVNWETILQGSQIDHGPAVGSIEMIIAKDNEIWKQLPSGTFVQAIGDSDSLELNFMTAIDDAFWAIDARSRIYKIEGDGTRSLQLSGGRYLDSLVKENGRYFALSGWGYFAPMTSVDGINWAEIPLSEFEEVVPDSDLPKIQKILHDGTRYMAICRRGGGGTIYEYVCTSIDGLDWEFAFPITYTTDSYHIENGIYYKFSRSVAWRSTDFQNWEVILVGDSSSSGLGEANGRFFFNTFYTDDFINWYPTEGIDWAFDFVYSNGVYLAINSVFEAGNVSISEDGETWSQASTVGINPGKLLATNDGFVGLTATGEIYSFPLRDLAATQLSWESREYGPGQIAFGTVTVENTGKLAWSSADPLEIEIWVTQSDRLYGRQSFALGNVDWDGALEPGSSVEIPVSVILPDGIGAGEYRSAVVIDPTRRTEDYSRPNNTLINRENDFLVPQWSVAFEINGGGAVLSQEPGALDFVHNTEETFVPIAQKGYLFGGWQNQEDPGLGPLTLTFNQNHEVEAIFNQGFEVELFTSGLGSVSSNTQTELVIANATIELQASAESGWRFEKWTGHVSSTANPLSIQMSEDIRLKAHFIPDGGLSYTDWAAARAVSGERAPLDHGSGNGRENLLNYFLGSQSPSDAIALSLHAKVDGYSLRVPWNPEIENVGFEVLYSDNLVKWLPLPYPPEATKMDGRDYLHYRFNTSSGNNYFFKVEVYEIE